jgi:hypothetical protein
MDTSVETIWRFVRGDIDPRAFEQWLYSHTTLEELLGAHLYLDVVSADFGDGEEIRRARLALEAFARSVTDTPCECVTLPDTAIVDMVNPGTLLDHFEELRSRGGRYWWLYVSRCTVCQTPWLVAQEERQNDVFVLRRLTNAELTRILTSDSWPTYFDAYGTLVRLGTAAGHRVRFLDPLGDSSLLVTMVDIAKEEPGIALAALAEMLNLDTETAAIIADQAILLHGAKITLGNEPWR